MKKPEKKKRKFYTGRKPCEYCEKIWHKCDCSKASVYNKGCDEMEAYHNWDIKENYIRKPSVKAVAQTIKENRTGSLCIPEVYDEENDRLARAIIEDIGGK